MKDKRNKSPAFKASGESSLGKYFKNKDSDFTGQERRIFHRRQLADRRNELRFEPGKTGRRHGQERRGGWGSMSRI